MESTQVINLPIICSVNDGLLLAIKWPWSCSICICCWLAGSLRWRMQNFKGRLISWKIHSRNLLLRFASAVYSLW